MRPTIVLARISACTLLAAIIAYSLIPQPPEPFSFDGVDKLEHGLAYAALSLLFCLGFVSAGSRASKAFLTVVPLFLVGAGIEFIQPTVGRRFDWFDMAANGLGLLAGCFAYLAIGKIRRAAAGRP